MRKNGWAVLAGLAMLCGHTAPLAAGDYTGSYFVTLGALARYTMRIEQTGATALFSLSGKGMEVAGGGTVAGANVVLESDLDGQGRLRLELEFSPTGNTCAGTWALSGVGWARGTVTASRTPWPTWDLATHSLPLLVAASPVELVKIGKISRFRSGEGHDYSDDFESCRSMKHYYLVRPGLDPGAVPIFSPVSGTVIGTHQEGESETLWKGTAVGIVPDGFPAFDFVLYHVELARPLGVGERVTAGQLLGSSAKSSGTSTDVAAGVHTPQGYRLISLFELMPDWLFAALQQYGVASRQALIITEAERNAQPLVCHGEQFASPGAIPNWVELSPPPAGRLRRRLGRFPG
jgi:hypothetical protein